MKLFESLEDRRGQLLKPGQQLPGHRCCPGCAGPIATKFILDVLGKNVIFFGPGGCGHGLTVKTVPCFTLHFDGVGSGAAGIAYALEVKGRSDIQVVSFAGDGGTADIGFGKLSACAERGDNIIHFCYDNEAYMNTGIQKSHLTPFGAWTTTTPAGKITHKKDMPMLIAHHRVPYVATVTVAYPADFKRKVKRAAEIRGFKYIHSLNPCPTGWRYNPEMTVELSRLAVETNIWPLYEIDNGVLKINLKPKTKPVEEYLKHQGRFRHLTKEVIQEIQNYVDRNWERLNALERKSLW
ncbi:MAG: thiamine pyrophosphate-dependent enzyme [Candidatus Bathyarchaeia archaeon]